MQQCRPPGEYLRIAPCHCHQHGKQHQHQSGGVLPDRRFAQQVINDPAKHDRSHGYGNRHGGSDIKHIGVDQIELGTGVIDNPHHGETRQPGDVALPFEPRQMLRQIWRRHQIFLDMIEAAAVNLPFFAVSAFGESWPLYQPEIERDEIEG